MDLLTLVAQCQIKKKSFLFSICMSCFFFCCVRCLYSNFFIMKCCCLLKRKSAQNIFVNQWCAINGQVLFLKVLNFLFGMVNYREKKKKKNVSSCFIQMWLKVNQRGKDPIWSVKQGTRLRYQTTGSIQLFSVFFSFLELHVHIVLWRACLQSAMCSVKALFVDDSSSIVALICCSACPLLFCTLPLCYVQCF